MVNKSRASDYYYLIGSQQYTYGPKSASGNWYRPVMARPIAVQYWGKLDH